jgi:phenylalanyl-tRNA synthetase beta chain
MLTGQPLHAFDYDKLVSVGGGKADIHVRAGKVDEQLELLDGRTITLTPGDIVIAAGDKAVGLAGAMGGLNTVIDENTKNIIIESATFNLYKLRSTQMRHGIFSEAITRFTKGQPAELTAPVLAEAVQLISEWSGAKRASSVAEAVGSIISNRPIPITVSRVNKLLGASLNVDQIVNILRSVEFAVVEESKDNLTVAAPYWRADIHVVEDIVEEIGRLLGFDSITPTLPSRNFAAVSPSPFDTFRANLRYRLARAGASEVLTYSFVHGDMMRKVGQNVENAYRITNSISPDLQYYRQSLSPSLLNLIFPNVKQGYERFAIFELNKIHSKSAGLTDENVPVEIDSVALGVASAKDRAGAAFYEAKRILKYMTSDLGISIKFE